MANTNDELRVTKPKAKPAKSTVKTPKSKAAKAVKASQPTTNPAPAEIMPKPTTLNDAVAEVAATPKPVVSWMKLPGYPGNMNMKKLVSSAIGVLAVLLVIVTLVFGVLVYGYQSDNVIVKDVSSVIPYPAETVNGTWVTYHQFMFEVNANEMADQYNAKLNNQPAIDYKSTVGKAQLKRIKQYVMTKLRSDVVTAQLASQKKIKVTSKDVDGLLTQLYQRYGGQTSLLKTLKQVYGWNLSDLKSVVYKQLLAQKLQTAVSADPALLAQAKAKATGIVAQLKAGADFATLAKQNSQASDASSGGDLGTFTAGQLGDAGLEAGIAALQPGQISDPIKTQYGYEVAKVISRDTAGTHAEHILIESVDFTTYLNAQVAKAKVATYLKVK